jgi:hypothetical protein
MCKTEVIYESFRADLVGVEFDLDRVGKRSRKSPYSRPEIYKKYYDRSFPDWFPIHKKMIAVELKLSDMGGVLLQAFNKASYAEESWIAMPEEYASKCLDKYYYSINGCGIGVLAVKPEGCQVLQVPRIVHYKSFNFVENAFLSERFWKYWIEQKQVEDEPEKGAE